MAQEGLPRRAGAEPERDRAEAISKAGSKLALVGTQLVLTTAADKGGMFREARSARTVAIPIGRAQLRTDKFGNAWVYDGDEIIEVLEACQPIATLEEIARKLTAGGERVHSVGEFLDHEAKERAGLVGAAVADHYAANAPRGLIDKLPDRLTNALTAMLGPNEVIHVMLKGAFKEGLICTDIRAIIIKGGFMTNQIFGTTTYQMPYANIAGAEVKAHLTTGYFQLNAGGMQETHKSYWSTQRGTDPKQAPNSISLFAGQFPRFQKAAAFILDKIAEAHRPVSMAISDAVAVTKRAPGDVLDALERLGKLKDSGVLTQQEFDAKKAELLALM